MSDFHDKLRDALKSVGESFRPEDIAAKQREFLYRRKRRRAAYAGGTLAFGAAVLAAVLFVTSGTTPVADKEPAPPAANPVPIITDVIRVGDGPSGIDVGSSGVWVANLNGDTVTRIDPTTNTVIDSVRVADAPDDLAVGEDLVWVGDDPGAENSALFGSISIVHGRSGELIDSRLALTREGQTESSLELGHIDLVANGNDLWAVTEAVPGPKVFQGEGLGGSYEADGFSPREIAIDDDAVWAFDAAHERLSSFSLPNGSEGGFHPVADVPRLADSQNDDLAAGLGAVWLTQGGILARIDRDSGEITSRIDLPGNFAALALGEGYVWAMSADSVDDSDLGWLTQIEPDTGKAIGEPLEIDGKPADVAVGGGAVWVTQHDADTVTRIELQTLEESPDPDISPTPDQTEAPTEYPLFVYVRDGDIWGQYADHADNLTESPEIETEPTISPDGQIVIFEQRFGKDNSTTIVQMDLSQGGTQVLFEGANPAIGPDNKLAWVVPATATDPAQIGTTLIGSRSQQFFDVGDPNSEPVGVDDLSWQIDGRRLYYVSSFKGYALDVAKVSDDFGGGGPDLSDTRWIQPDDVEVGSTFIAPSSAFATNAIRMCCSTTVDADYSTASFGQVASNGHFLDVLNLDDLRLSPPRDGWYTGYLGHLRMKDDGSWVTGTERPSWYVGDGRNVWILDDFQHVERLPFDVEVTDFAAQNELYR